MSSWPAYDATAIQHAESHIEAAQASPLNPLEGITYLQLRNLVYPARISDEALDLS